jgi:hypothetical protein
MRPAKATRDKSRAAGGDLKALIQLKKTAGQELISIKSTAGPT